jgi:O-antigen ligase
VSLPATVRTAALAWFFFAIGCYTMLAPIDGPIPIGAAVVPRDGAIVLAASLVAAGIIALCSLAGVWRDERLATSRVTLAAWLAALIVPSLLGFNLTHSLEVAGMALLCAIVHVALVRWWAAPGVAPAVLWTATSGGFVLAIAAIVMQLTHRPADVYAANLGRATGFFVTPNQFAAWLVPYTALAAGLAVSSQRLALRLASCVAALVGAVALVATFSIGGWIGGATAGILALWWLGRRALAAGAVVVIALVAVVAVADPAITHHRLSERLVRLDAIGAGVRVATAFPLTGVGPMNYALLYAPFRAPQSTEDAIISTHPHDVIVSLFAETGVAGVAAIALGWWWIGRAILAAARRADGRTQALTACICAGIIGRFVHGFVDLVGVVELAFFWIPFAGVALAVARNCAPAAASAPRVIPSNVEGPP